MYLVRQLLPDRGIPDIPGTVARELEAADFAARVAPGARVAIGVGSRGIANIATIVRAVVDYWKAKGMRPFLFPAMGSHGAATAAGQAEVLAYYGIHEASMGCPVVSQLEVVSLGVSPEGIEACMDKAAYESGGVMLIGRVKWHTDFAGKIESGLFKMMAIGLGKFAGAKRYHTHAYRMGMEKMILSVGRQVLRSGRILGGLAILEDAHHHTGQLTAVRVEEMEQKEAELLALAKSWMARVPADVDILILDEMGKNISGAGNDTKVINRDVHSARNVWDTAPSIDRIFVRDLSEISHGNAVGVGLADMVTTRLVEKIDWKPTVINSLTASTLGALKTPYHCREDRECLEVLCGTVGKFDARDVRIAWARNTLDLVKVAMSENLEAEIRGNALLEIVNGPWEMEFGGEGNLRSPFQAG